MLQKDYITNILGIANISADKIERNREGVHIYIHQAKRSRLPVLRAKNKVYPRLQNAKDKGFKSVRRTLLFNAAQTQICMRELRKEVL